ncbi:MAG: hypothetical protein OHK0013_05570 [Sandaracinaceae bacterium]
MPLVTHAQQGGDALGYDATALLDHVRPEERAQLAHELDVGDLSELPLYELHVAVDDRLRGFGMRETVTVTNREARPWRDVVMRIFVNATTGAEPRVRFLEGRCLDGVSCELVQTAPSVIEIRPDRPIAPGTRLRFELDLQGEMPELPEDRLGMMAQGFESLAAMEAGAGGATGDYGLVAHGAQIGSLAAFYPVLARRARGRWVTDDGGTMGDLSTDAPHHVRVRLVVPEDFVVASSGVEVSVADVSDRPGRAPRKEITIHAAAVRELAILMSPRFVSRECDAEGVRVRSFFLVRDREAGEHVGDVACAAFRVFTRRFGAYPYTELDVVEAPLVGGAGGVEFSGLVTVALMFYRGALEGGGAGGLGMLGALGALGGGGGDPAQGLSGLDAMTASMREFVTAHEVAHQWWHGLVGSDSRNHPWVDESLAQYAAMLYVEERHGRARAREEGERQVAMNYRVMRLQGRPDGIVDRPASAFASPIEYAGLVYGKGPYFYEAVRARVGDDAFFRGLASYVAAYRMREAPPDAVITHLARASGGRDAEVRGLARRWLEERHGDEDLGPSDAGRLMRTMMPPELAQVMDDPVMGPMLRQMLGSMLAGQGISGAGALGGSGAAGESGAAGLEALESLLGGGGDVDEAELRRRIEALQREAGAGTSAPRRPVPRRVR